MRRRLLIAALVLAGTGIALLGIDRHDAAPSGEIASRSTPTTPVGPEATTVGVPRLEGVVEPARPAGVEREVAPAREGAVVGLRAGPYPITVQFQAAEDGRHLDLQPHFAWAADDRRVHLSIDVPDGLVEWGWGDWYLPEVRGITRLELVCPLWPEALLRMSVEGPQGRRAGPITYAVEDAGTGSSYAAARVSESEASGVRVLRVPHIRGLQVRFWAQGEVGDDLLEGSESVRLGPDPRVERHVLVRLSEPASTGGLGSHELIGIGGGAGGDFRGRRGTEYGSVRVLLQRRADRASDRVRVRISSLIEAGVTDETGRALFAQVPAGEARVQVRQIGVVPFEVPVIVAANRETFVVLREPVGARLAVRVVDADGRPMPYALVWVEQPSRVEWLDLDDEGVLRLDKFTDHEGRREFHHLEAGTVKVRSSLGSLTGEAIAETVDGRLSAVEIVLR